MSEMIRSGMTGFGRADGTADWGLWSVEAKSVNGRGLDVRVTLPSGLDELEQQLKAAGKAKFLRGNVQVFVSIQLIENSSGGFIDRRMLAALMRERRKWHRGASASRAPIDPLLALRGVIANETRSRISLDADQMAAIMSTANTAFDALKTARQAEGWTLKGLLEGFLNDMSAQVETAKTLADVQPEEIKARVQTRLNELLGDSEIDPDRLAQEAAVIAMKADIREEIDRLVAHIEDGRALMNGDGAVGRKLDFLSQELLREANTLSSKSTSLELTRISLALKALIDQFKEQSANVE